MQGNSAIQRVNTETDMEFHIDLFIIRINEQERIVEQSGGGGEARLTGGGL